MKYELIISASHGDRVPLDDVAIGMAMRDATAGGTPYHQPTFAGRLRIYKLGLLEEVRAGRLPICNEAGNRLYDVENVQAIYLDEFVLKPDWDKLRRENPPLPPGVWDLSHIDLGPRKKSDRPYLLGLQTKLTWLNDWAEKQGDSFTLSHEGRGWVDERGYILPSEDPKDTRQGLVQLQPSHDQIPTASMTGSWQKSARKIWETMARLHKKLNQEQIAEKVHQEMKLAKDRGETGMTGRGGRVPSAASIKRHRLRDLNI